jgi:hypothetical protein
MTELDFRASDGDRERVVDELRAHAAVGRLSVDELEERVQRALAARTRGELAGLTRDLPDDGPPLSPHPPSPRPRRPDRRAYLAVMVLMVAIWAVTGAGYFWPVWPLVGWGLFVLGPRHRLRFPACHPSVSSRR